MKTIENNVYVAYHDNGVCIAMDEYSISQVSSGFHIDSNNTVFGVNGFQQKAILRTDDCWQMQELKVAIESMNIEMCANVKDRKVYVQQKQQNAVGFEKIFELQNDKFFYIYSGALVIPMIWLRGFSFDNYEKVAYQMLPAGFVEIKQLTDTVSENNLRTFSLLMYLQNFTDIVKIRTDISGKILSLYSETCQLTIIKQNKL